MEKESTIFGKNLSAENAEGAKAFLEEQRKESQKPLEGEPEKTMEELKIVDRINAYAAEEFEELGIKDAPSEALAKEGKPEIPPEQIHFLPAAVYNKNFPDAKDRSFAFHDPETGAVYINSFPYAKTQLFKVTLHESLHTLSHHKYFASVEARSIRASRAGYGAAHFGQPEEFHEHFRGLNEAVTDAMAREIMEKHRGDIAKEFHLTPEQAKMPIHYYDDYIGAVEAAVDGIAVKNKESREEVWKRFKRGMFTGEMMHLRDVEKTFGKESLQVLAAMGGEPNPFLNDFLTQRIRAYFETGSEDERQKLAKLILKKSARKIKIDFD